MRSHLIRGLFLCVLLPACGLGQAGAPAASQTLPVGRWKTVDDATGKPKSVVTISEENGKLYGKIDKLLDPDSPDHCIHCEGELKGKPLIGLQILWDLKKDGEQWSGGKILDPHNGKIYKCTIAVLENGEKLKVRGFIGFSLLGRTQYWLREE